MSWLSKLLNGKNTGNPGQGAQDLGMKEYFDAIKEYENGGNNQYSWLGDLDNVSLGNTEMDKIQSDPRLKGYEMQALADLEQQSKDGLSLRDQADLARLEGQVNRQNAGRLGAIQQSMAARGMAGSGLELAAQLQANQDATERQALASLEKGAMAQQGRQQAIAQLGQQAGQMSARDFQQQAQRAAAQDAINRFNVANQNQTNQLNWQGQQGIANQNVAQNNQFAQNKAQMKQGGAQMRYNSGVEANNQAAARRAGKQSMVNGLISAAGTVGGAAIGSMLGPAGTVAGAAAGNKLAGEAYRDPNTMYAAHGGVVPGHAQHPGDHPANDTVPAMLSPGEVVVPRSIVTKLPEGDPVDAIAKLLSKRK